MDLRSSLRQALRTFRFGQVIWMIVFQSMRLVLAGLAVGLIAAFVLTRVLSATLTELSGFDPLMLMSMCGILLGVPLAAAVVPAQRAARIDPIVALRYE